MLQIETACHIFLCLCRLGSIFARRASFDKACSHSGLSQGRSSVSSHWLLSIPSSFPPRYTKRLIPVPSPGFACSLTQRHPVAITPLASK